MNTFIKNSEIPIIILCTIPNDHNRSLKIIQNLLNLKLAACITVLQKVHSYYYWDNELKTQTEYQILIKTKYSLQKLVFNKIKELHPYKIPELLTIPIIDGEKNYLNWIHTTLNSSIHKNIIEKKNQ